MEQVEKGIVMEEKKKKKMQRVFKNLEKDKKKIKMNIERKKEIRIGVQKKKIIKEIKQKIGGYLVNKLNKIGSKWKVIIKGEKKERKKVEDIYRINVS